jgi:hypothetical protein
MWAFAAAAALTYGLFRAAAAEPARKARRKHSRLQTLLSVPSERLTLDQAEDGASLARFAGDTGAEISFRNQISRLRKQRRK